MNAALQHAWTSLDLEKRTKVFAAEMGWCLQNADKLLDAARGGSDAAPNDAKSRIAVIKRLSATRLAAYTFATGVFVREYWLPACTPSITPDGHWAITWKDAKRQVDVCMKTSGFEWQALCEGTTDCGTAPTVRAIVDVLKQKWSRN